MSELKASSPRNYLTEIDGLRAIAILAVLLFHAGVGADGGFVGVDVFFVVSGYLIAKQLSLTPGFSFVRIVAFWFRRIRRIVPALSVVSLCAFVLSLFLLMPNEQMEFGESLQASSFFSPITSSLLALGILMPPHSPNRYCTLGHWAWKFSSIF